MKYQICCDVCKLSISKEITVREGFTHTVVVCLTCYKALRLKCAKLTEPHDPICQADCFYCKTAKRILSSR